MKTHELKLDVKYFEDVKSGKKNFEIRNNDRDFQVGDILELKAYVKGLKKFAKWGEIIDPFNHFRMSHNYMTCAEEDADTIKVKVVYVLSANDVNEGIEFMSGDETAHATINGQVLVLSQVEEVLKKYLNVERMPDDYVVLGIEVVK